MRRKLKISFEDVFAIRFLVSSHPCFAFIVELVFASSSIFLSFLVHLRNSVALRIHFESPWLGFLFHLTDSHFPALSAINISTSRNHKPKFFFTDTTVNRTNTEETYESEKNIRKMRFARTFFGTKKTRTKSLSIDRWITKRHLRKAPLVAHHSSLLVLVSLSS